MPTPADPSLIFQSRYGRAPEAVVRAPGRVNLIGEHTDYNHGYVFPAALEFDIRIAMAPRDDQQVRVYAESYGQESLFGLDALTRSDAEPWSNYVRGVAFVLAEAGYALAGMDAVVVGTVPVGSGLSSSAAFEMAACWAFEFASGIEIDPVRRAVLCQRAENRFVGMNCGIMDQFISSLGKANHALFIDTHTLEFRPVPLPTCGVSLVITNTNRPHELVKSAYNERRAECERAVELLRPEMPGLEYLRHVSEAQFEALQGLLPDPVVRRARHVVTEDERVLRAISVLEAGDVAAFGELMTASHRSLRDDYEVSCPELDALVAAALTVEGVYGSRMTGAGFGGCTVSLVADAAVPQFQDRVRRAYTRATCLEPSFYVCRAAEGASRIA
jgi:galactokinase